MKVVARTNEYTIYQKRSGRYGVKDADKRWVNGADKSQILFDHKLISAAPAAAPEPEPEAAAEPEVEADAEATADSTEEGASEE